MSNQDIIILGAGIVGKTAALALSQKGLRVLHLAKDFTPQNPIGRSETDKNTWDQRVYAISQSSEALLKSLHVWDEIPQDRIQPVIEMKVFGDSGQVSDQLHFSAFESAVPKLASIIEATQIESALDLASRFSKTLQRQTFSNHTLHLENKDVSIQTDQGSFSATLIIAADGAFSPTRQALGIDVKMDEYEHTAVVANFTCTQSHLQTAYQWFLNDGDILAFLPLPNKKVSIVWSTQAQHAQELVALAQTNPEQFCQTVQLVANGRPEHFLGDLHLISEAKSFPIRRILANQLIGPKESPCVLLIGDAAHVMHPLAGQGLNLGLRDIRDFLTLLDQKESFRSISDKVFLRRYERMRAGDVQAILSVTHGLYHLFRQPQSTVRWLRNTGLRIINQQALLKQKLTEHALS